jgi:D-glycero-alpha-D-manno-heptose-7-phosphate kinase
MSDDYKLSFPIEAYVIDENAAVRQALAKIDANHEGVVLVIDASGAVVGLVTDGDIRRKLLENVSLDDPIQVCANPDFVHAHAKTSREHILKQLDNQIRAIPLLDDERRLVNIITRYQVPLQREQPVYARARAPVRVSFGGGGSDLTHYFSSRRGAVVNTTIAMYSHAVLRKRADHRIIVGSLDLKQTLEAENLDAAFKHQGPFGLILALLRAIHPEFGFELYINSDFPVKSGLGGSAAVSAAILGCFNQFRQDRWDLHEISELAFQAERFYLGISGGWQDQYATVFGGFNFMEFGMEETVVTPLRVHADTLLELEESLVLCDTGIAHESGNIHDHQRVSMQREEIRGLVEESVNLTYRLRNQLLRGQLLAFGQSLDEAWQIKRRLSGEISSEWLDSHYDAAIMRGAVGGKLLGAGGGGFFLFYVPPFRRHQFVADLSELSMHARAIRFEERGLQAWTVREDRQNSEQDGR